MAEPGPSELASASPDNASIANPAPTQEQLQPTSKPAPQTPRNPASGYESGADVLSGSESDGANPGPNGADKAGADPQRAKSKKKKKKHKKINREHPEFELTYDMMLGIRTTVSQAEAKPLRELHHNDFTDSLKLQFKSEGTSTTPAHQMRDFKFKDYAPEVFRRLRTRFGIKAADYLLCVCGNFQYLEFISNSKSGQFFFYTHNRQFMIKTVSKDESKFLRKILPHYYHHVMSNPNTLLTRFYGMHRVKPHKKKEVHFLIFASVFYNSKFIHVTFDIKGSTLNRNATENDKQEAACVYKDNDFLEKKMKIKMGPARAKLLQEQIDKDVEFLRQLSIMDYSLLLGVHYGDRPVVKGRNRSVSEPGGAVPTSGDEAEDDEESEYDPVAKVRRPSKRPSFVITGTGAVSAGPSNPASAVTVTSEPPAAPDGDTLGPLVTVAAPMDEKAVPTTEDDGPQAHYGLPANYTKFSKPDDIHFVAPEFAPVNVPERKEESANKTQIKVVQSIFTADDGGVRGVDSNGNPLQEWYYFGIIDILTLYGMRKRVEHFGKALKYKSETISAVNPKFYAKRFKTFLSESLE